MLLSSIENILSTAWVPYAFAHLSQTSLTQQWNKDQLSKGKQGPRTNQIELTWPLA